MRRAARPAERRMIYHLSLQFIFHLTQSMHEWKQHVRLDTFPLSPHKATWWWSGGTHASLTGIYSRLCPSSEQFQTIQVNRDDPAAPPLTGKRHQQTTSIVCPPSLQFHVSSQREFRLSDGGAAPHCDHQKHPKRKRDQNPALLSPSVLRYASVKEEESPWSRFPGSSVCLNPEPENEIWLIEMVLTSRGQTRWTDFTVRAGKLRCRRVREARREFNPRSDQIAELNGTSFIFLVDLILSWMTEISSSVMTDICRKSRQQLINLLVHQETRNSQNSSLITFESGNFLPLLTDSLKVSMRQQADCQMAPRAGIYSVLRHMVLFTQHHLSLLVLKKHICSDSHVTMSELCTHERAAVWRRNSTRETWFKMLSSADDEADWCGFHSRCRGKRCTTEIENSSSRWNCNKAGRNWGERTLWMFNWSTDVDVLQETTVTSNPSVSSSCCSLGDNCAFSHVSDHSTKLLIWTEINLQGLNEFRLQWHEYL